MVGDREEWVEEEDETDTEADAEVDGINWALPVGELAAEQEPIDALLMGGELVLDTAEDA